jgi:hypothetical protein
MNTKVISSPSMVMIDQYKNFKIESAVCSIPYFNNKSTGKRAALGVNVGKGSPKEIYDEILTLARLQKIDIKLFNSETLKKFMISNNIGIDCSGFVYHVLNEESISRGKGSIDRHIHFVNASNIITRLIAKLKPQTNTDVLTLSSNKNSKVVEIKDAQVGDIITMIGTNTVGIRNHVLIIHQIEYQNFIPITIHYTHAIAWPTDGEYGHGIHEGKIEVVDINKTLCEQRWIELQKDSFIEPGENYTYTKAKTSTTELRRMNCFI